MIGHAKQGRMSAEARGQGACSAGQARVGQSPKTVLDSARAEGGGGMADLFCASERLGWMDGAGAFLSLANVEADGGGTQRLRALG